jgi:hypothetical protein
VGWWDVLRVLLWVFEGCGGESAGCLCGLFVRVWACVGVCGSVKGYVLVKD